MDFDEDTDSIANCKDLLRFIRKTIFRKNYLEVKESFLISKHEFLGFFKSKSNSADIENPYETDDEDVGKAIKKKSSLSLTRQYIGVPSNGRFPQDTLLYYLNGIEDDEKVDLAFVQEILRNGVMINWCNKNNENAIFKAVQLENEMLVTFLLENNINITQVNKNGCNIFHIAARNLKHVLTRLLAARFDSIELKKYVDAKSNDESQTPLHYAAKKGSIEVAESLITECHADRESRDYKQRTPLYIAAEYAHQLMVKSLIRLNCCASFTDSSKAHTLNNINGQSALYWIVDKMPDIASEVFDQLHETNLYLKKEHHYISALEPSIVKGQKTEDIPKSILDSIVESQNLDLISHPTVKCLIDYKWNKFARLDAWIDFIITVLNILVWVAVAILYPFNNPARYYSNQTLEEIATAFSLLGLGVLFTCYYIYSEMKEIYYEYKYQKKANDLRRRELEEYKNTCVEKDINNNFYVDEIFQINQNNLLKILFNYITDTWNVYDLISVGLSIAYLNAYFSDPKENRNQKIQVMAFTIIFIFLRLLKTLRLIVPKFGTLVMVLYYTISELVVWICVFSVVWLSFSISVYTLYGGKNFDVKSRLNPKCVDPRNETANAINNCTVLTLPQFETFAKTVYVLFRQAFGTDVDEKSMELVNDDLTSGLMGVYVGLTVLVLLNIFIGLLSSTFTKVYEKAEAFILFQRAIEILNAEKQMSFIEKRFRIKKLRKNGHPYTTSLSTDLLTYDDDRIQNLENEINEQRKLLINMERNLEYKSIAFRYQCTKTNNSLDKIEKHEARIENIIEKRLKLSKTFSELVDEFNKENGIKESRSVTILSLNSLSLNESLNDTEAVIEEKREEEVDTKEADFEKKTAITHKNAVVSNIAGKGDEVAIATEVVAAALISPFTKINTASNKKKSKEKKNDGKYRWKI